MHLPYYHMQCKRSICSLLFFSRRRLRSGYGYGCVSDPPRPLRIRGLRIARGYIGRDWPGAGLESRYARKASEEVRTCLVCMYNATHTRTCNCTRPSIIRGKLQAQADSEENDVNVNLRRNRIGTNNPSAQTRTRRCNDCQ